MNNDQYNAYNNFLGGESEQIVIIYEKLIELTTLAKEDSKLKKKNLEQVLDIIVKLISSTEWGEITETKKKIQAFYLLLAKNVLKILYCNQDEIYDKVIRDIEIVKLAWEQK